MRERIVLISSLAVVALASAACGGGNAGAQGRTTVVAAFYPLAFAAARVGDDDVDVRNLTPPGAEPHDVELSARDVADVRSADLVVYLGSGFQPALERALDGAEGRAVDVLEGLDLLEADDEETVDPHVWLDPLRYAEIVERIGDELGRPTGAERLADELRALDRELEDGLADCRSRELVTSHAAFGYLADRYDLRQIPITGLSPEAEPTPRELEEVTERVREAGATTIYFETLVSPRLAEAVARETGAATAVLNPIEGLTEEEFARGEDYFSLMRANLEALRAGLGCR